MIIIALLLSSFISFVFPLSSSWNSLSIKFNRFQCQRDLQINLFSEQFTDAIKECYTLDGFSIVSLPQELSVIQGMIAKKQMISVIKSNKVTVRNP